MVVLLVGPLDGPCQPVATGTAHERAIIFLLTSGERVYGVRVLSSTLEDAYLEAVGERVE